MSGLTPISGTAYQTNNGNRPPVSTGYWATVTKTSGPDFTDDMMTGYITYEDGTTSNLIGAAVDSTTTLQTFNSAPVAEQPFTLTYGVPAGQHTFTNKTRKNSLTIPSIDYGYYNYAGTVSLQYSFLFPEDNLHNKLIANLNWKTGDKLVYSSNGGTPIGGLVDGATYYAVVYIPGYTCNGLVKNNNVTNCLVSGFQDNKKPTASAWLSNTAFNNGSHKKDEYAIYWSGEKPIAYGSLKTYPKPKTYIDNIAIRK